MNEWPRNPEKDWKGRERPAETRHRRWSPEQEAPWSPGEDISQDTRVRAKPWIRPNRGSKGQKTARQTQAWNAWTPVSGVGQKVQVQNNGQETTMERSRTSWQEDGSQTAMTRRPFLHSPMVPQLQKLSWKGSPRAGGRSSEHPDKLWGMKGTEGPGNPDCLCFSCLDWCPGMSISNPEHLLKVKWWTCCWVHKAFFYLKKKKWGGRGQKSVSIPFWGIPLKICFQ